MTKCHGPRLNGTHEGPPLGGPMEIGPPLRGPTEDNRPLLGAVALSPTQSGTTGPSPTRLVEIGSRHHTGPTCTMTTRHGSRHSGPTKTGPPLGGPTDENRQLLGAVALLPMQSGTTGLTEPTEENRLNVTNEGSPLRGPTEVGLPLGGPTTIGPLLGGPKDKNRPLLGAVASLPMQSGMTGLMEPIEKNRLNGTN